jgi:hypothetical protein
MNTRLIFASLITTATLAACSSPTVLNLEDLGAQPTLEELNADNDSSLELSGSTGGLGNLLVRKIYDTNQNGKYDDDEQGIPDWGVRIVSVDANGNPDDAADIQVTPQGSGRWRGVNLKVPYGRYKIEELAPTGTKQFGASWKVTGPTSRIVNVSREKSVRAIEFAGVCLENGVLVKFPKITDFANWKCRATFDLLPRIANFSVLPTRISAGESSIIRWNVLDYAKIEITPGVGVVTGFTGSKSVTPSSTTTYTIKVTNGFGSSSLSSTVEVGAAGLWQTPTAFSDQILPSAGAALARGPNDRAMLAFTSRSPTDSLYEDVVVNTYINPQGWTGFERIGKVVHSNQGGETAYAKVSANGDAFVLVTSQGSRTVTAFRKPNGGSWNATPLELGILSGRFVYTPQISLDTDAAGNAFVATPACAVLTGSFCSEYGTAVTRFSPQTGWSTPTLVGSKQAAISQTRIAVNASGEASLIIDVAAQGTTPGEIQYATFTPSTGWTTAKPIAVSDTSTTSIGSLSLNIEASGNSNLVWKTSDALCISGFNNQSKDPGNCIIEPGNVSVGVGGNGILWVFSTTAFQSVIVRQYEPRRGLQGWTQFETLPVTGKDATTPIDSFNAQILSVNENNTIFAALTVVYKTTNPFPETTTYALRRSTGFSLKQTTPILYLDPASTRANLLGLVTFSDGSALAVGTDVAANGRPQLLSNINR